jgi:hypothetical protein
VVGEKGVGFGRRVGVSLRLGGAIGWFVLVASSGLSSGLEYGGCQMLGLSSRRQLNPRHEAIEQRWNAKVSVREDSSNNCGQ